MKLPWNKPKRLKLNTKELDKPPYLKLNKGKQKRKPLELWLKKLPLPKLKLKRKQELSLKRRMLQKSKLYKKLSD